MIIMSLNMLDIFLFLRKFIPRMPKIIGEKIYGNKGKYSPFYVGLLNGLMPCGPLQSMQIYALGTGSLVSGALSMFIFSLGTLPLMFGFGAITSMLSSKFTHKMLKASAALVMVLGVIMLNRGFALSGINPTGILDSTKKIKDQNKNEDIASISGGVQYVTTKITTRSYPSITVKKRNSSKMDNDGREKRFKWLQ